MGEFLPNNIPFKNLDILEENYVILEIKDNEFGWTFDEMSYSET